MLQAPECHGSPVLSYLLQMARLPTSDSDLSASRSNTDSESERISSTSLQVGGKMCKGCIRGTAFLLGV